VVVIVVTVYFLVIGNVNSKDSHKQLPELTYRILTNIYIFYISSKRTHCIDCHKSLSLKLNFI
jgi:hypothetical protein